MCAGGGNHKYYEKVSTHWLDGEVDRVTGS